MLRSVPIDSAMLAIQFKIVNCLHNLNAIQMEKESWFRNILVYVGIVVIPLLIVGNIATCATAKRVGADCCDGTSTTATSSGACSGHGGVRNWRKHYWFSDMDEPWKSIGRAFSGISLEDSQCQGE